MEDLQRASAFMQTIRCVSLAKLGMVRTPSWLLHIPVCLSFAWPCRVHPLESQLTHLLINDTDLLNFTPILHDLASRSDDPQGKFLKFPHQAHSHSQILCMPAGAKWVYRLPLKVLQFSSCKPLSLSPFINCKCSSHAGGNTPEITPYISCSPSHRSPDLLP